MYPIKIGTYILVGLIISILNPLIEEYFWRAFIFENYSKFKKGILTGALFSLHHIVILYNWLNLPLLIITTILLSITGIYLNHLYKTHNNSIYPHLISHFGADLSIILIGIIILF